MEHASGDGGRLYRRSHSLLLAHEDKTYPGAMIASLSIPWGESKGDEDLGGYHLVWTRDLCNSAMALIASGNVTTPLRALIYLAVTQNPDGGFPQNFWVNGEPYWHGVQLDEVAFPIMLAWRLHEEDALRDFDPYPMVLAAAGYLVRDRTRDGTGSVGGGERVLAEHAREQRSPASPAPSLFARGRGDDETARYLSDYADFLEGHIEAWTVTTAGDPPSGRAPPLHAHQPRRSVEPASGRGSRSSATSASRTSRRTSRRSSPPTTWSTRASWSSSATAYAGPETRSWRTRSGWSTRS